MARWRPLFVVAAVACFPVSVTTLSLAAVLPYVKPIKRCQRPVLEVRPPPSPGRAGSKRAGGLRAAKPLGGDFPLVSTLSAFMRGRDIALPPSERRALEVLRGFDKDVEAIAKNLEEDRDQVRINARLLF
jgi:hypothetical protein